MQKKKTAKISKERRRRHPTDPALRKKTRISSSACAVVSLCFLLLFCNEDIKTTSQASYSVSGTEEARLQDYNQSREGVYASNNVKHRDVSREEDSIKD